MFLKIVYCVLGTILLLFPTKTTVKAVIASYASNKIDENVIKNVNVSVAVYSEMGLCTPQLQVSWTDNLPNDTNYNVFVEALNTSYCSEFPCSVTSVRKPTDGLVLPIELTSIVDEMECGYMFGCNYTVKVETSNTMIQKTQLVAITHGLMDTCECQYTNLPIVLLEAQMPENDTIDMKWHIKLDNDDTQQSDEMMETLQSAVLHLIINERTNPSLTWGGRHNHIKSEAYPFNATQYDRVNDTLMGELHVKLKSQLPARTELQLDAYIRDKSNCLGPFNATKVRVPPFSAIQPIVIREHFDLGISLIIITALFLTGIVSALVFAIWRRRVKKTHATLQKNDNCLSPFATVIEMEDNINYVDKYVEEAQAKGLADIFEMPHHAIELGPEIGEGAFGRVYKATATNLRRMRGTTLVAVKQLKKYPTADEVAEFLSEIEMLKGVGTHNNIVCFLGCCTIRPPYLMVMEYVGRGDLLSYLRTVRYEAAKLQPKDANHINQRSSSKSNTQSQTPAVKYIEMKMSTESVDSDAVTETRQPMPSFAETTYTIIEDDECNEPFQYILDHKELHNFALQIANGMRFLEEQEITHRDLAARNVLIDERKTLKISDFGLSRHGIYTNTKTRKLPLRWLSIEAIRDNLYSSKSDVWAYGVVLWEIGTLGASPYPTISNHELIPFLRSGQRLERPEICTEQVYSLMLQCWDEEPENRPTFEELYKVLCPKSAYIDINSLSDDYVFPPIRDKENNTLY